MVRYTSSKGRVLHQGGAHLGAHEKEEERGSMKTIVKTVSVAEARGVSNAVRARKARPSLWPRPP